MRYRADLHIHSCLSPCADLQMSPSSIVSRASSLGISVLGLTDHNTCRNLPAFDSCCRKAGIMPVHGIEVTTREEIHVLCFFADMPAALRFGKFIESLLPDVPNAPDLLGDQVYVDEHERIIGEIDKSLYSASELNFDQLFDEVQGYNGMFIPAHIDRSAFSVTSQLGFLPEMTYTAVEAVRIPCRVDTYGNTVITNSDAHFLADIGSRSWSCEHEAMDYQALKHILETDRLTR